METSHQGERTSNSSSIAALCKPGKEVAASKRNTTNELMMEKTHPTHHTSTLSFVRRA
jgi:hypothetical protein